jgi:small multidrug resistance pump
VSCEIAGALSLRLSNGFTRTFPTVLALAAFAVALYLVSHVMKELPVSIAYPVWAGGGTAGVALLGVLALGEPLGLLKLAGIALVLVGVVLVNRVGEKRSGC